MTAVTVCQSVSTVYFGSFQSVCEAIGSGHSKETVSQINKADSFFSKRKKKRNDFFFFLLCNSAEKGSYVFCGVGAPIIKIFISANCRLLSNGCVVLKLARTHTQIKPSDIRPHHNTVKHTQARRHTWGETGTRTPLKKLSSRDL